MNQICYRQLAETIQIFKALHLLFSAMYCEKHSNISKEAFHKLCFMMKADQNPAQNISLDIASNGKNALASLRPTNGC